MSSTVIATDLDRTMIYSRAAMTGEQFDVVDPVCVEYYEGAPLSYMTAAATALLAELAARLPVVPTTTRTPEQFGRIMLPGGPFRYAVTSNGGAILVDGRRDAHWDHVVAQRCADGSASLPEIITALRARTPAENVEWVRKFRVADDLFCYLVVEPSGQPLHFLSDWRAYCEPRGWSVSQQGRKIYTMPLAVTKSSAIAEVRRRLVADGALAPENRLLAAGDGWLDRDLLLSADAAMRPRHGELDALGFTASNLTVTATSGALAGEEILTWLRDAAAPPTRPLSPKPHESRA